MLGEVDGVGENKRVILEMITAVWVRGDLDALGRYWTEDCRNHADTARQDGLTALRRYHEDFAMQMVGLADFRIDVVQQVGEGDRVVTHLRAGPPPRHVRRHRRHRPRGHPRHGAHRPDP